MKYFWNNIINGLLHHPDGDLGILDDKVDDKVDDKDKDLSDEKDKDDKTPDDKEEKDDDLDDDDLDDDDLDDDKKEDDELEDENENPNEDDVNEKILTTWTDIKKKYPDFNKDFPDVKNALFREQQFSEVFSTPAEAQDIVDRVATFDQLSDDIVGNGNIVDLLNTVKDKNKESYEKITYSILPYLQEHDKDAYYELAMRPIKQLLRSAWAEGQGEKTDLGKAAAHIHKFFFKNLNFDEKVKAEGGIEKEKKSSREAELETRLSQIEQGKQNDFISSVDDSYISKMSKHIREGLDKDGRLTEWTKSKVVEEILKGVKVQLKKDTRYVSALNSLLKQASSSGFTNDFKTRIINTALVRAKSLVPDVRKRVVGEALSAGKKKDDREVEKEETPRRDRETRRESRGSSSTSTNQPKKPITDMDILRS